MNKKVQYKGQFRVYIMWPLYAAILLLVLDIVLFTQNITCGIVGVAFTLVYGVCAYFSSEKTAASDKGDGRVCGRLRTGAEDLA